MTDPIERLQSEHVALLDRFGELRRAIRTLEQRGEAGIGDALPTLVSISKMMATDLRAHARREDEALFPALEAAFGSVVTPADVMREEHREIHAQADLFHQTLHELNEVEHPKIMAGAVAMQGLAEPGASAEALRTIGQMVLDLIDAHFAKEETILFPMAREVLSPADLAKVAEKMDQLDAAPAVGAC